MIELDERALRRANPSRATAVAIADEGAADVKDVAEAARLLAKLDPFDDADAARIGKKVGGADADAYFRRWPDEAGRRLVRRT